MFRKYQHIHFVGIGGIGMSGIAEVLLTLGYRVSGSDLKESETTRRLRDLGGTVAVGHQAENVAGAHVVVVSSAVTPANVEVAAAREAGVPVIPRAEMLAELMRLKYGVAIAGAHGKTTTTSLVASVLAQGGLDPTVVIGGKVNALGAGARLGQGDFMVVEADESDGSFLKLSPTVVAVTNIDREHLDYYTGGMPEIQEAFATFVNKVPFYGAAILCLDDPAVQELLPRVKKRAITYGFSGQADVRGRDVELAGAGSSFRVEAWGADIGTFRLSLPGRHNVLNALAAVAVGLELEIPVSDVREGLDRFAGVARRFQVKGSRAGVTVVDDYGHHPTEIRATLAAGRGVVGGGGRLFVIFQPHRYTRTRDLKEEFWTAFYDADRLIVADIYPAGEAPIPGVTALSLFEGIRAHGHKEAAYIPDREEIVAAVTREVRPGDWVLTLGAGDVWRVGEEILARLPALEGIPG
jgi:UDP-N-acetylmuramate--alanine ligase